MPTILSFKIIQNKHDISGGKDYRKMFWQSLREYTSEMKLWSKNMNLLINEQPKSYENKKFAIYMKKQFEDKHAKDKEYRKDRENCYYTE